MSFLKVENYRKSFGNTEVLKGVSFELEKGQVLAIIGSSGGGKTGRMGPELCVCRFFPTGIRCFFRKNTDSG